MIFFKNKPLTVHGFANYSNQTMANTVLLYILHDYDEFTFT